MRDDVAAKLRERGRVSGHCPWRRPPLVSVSIAYRHHVDRVDELRRAEEKRAARARFDELRKRARLPAESVELKDILDRYGRDFRNFMSVRALAELEQECVAARRTAA